MRSFIRVVSGVTLLAATVAFAHALPSAADDHSSIVIVFKDGHHQSFATTQIARVDLKAQVIVYKDGHREKLSDGIDRIEFNPVDVGMQPSRNHFIGKWEVGEGGNTGSKFFITLDADGSAKKSIGATHGTWTLVDGEARIAWDDGWHDVIRKVGSTHEKVAFEPGRGFDEQPSNITAARNTQPRPI